MSEKRTIEIFSAGCPACEDTIQLVNQMACPSCEVSVLDVNDATVAVQSVPAVAINGELADCCASRGPDAGALQAAGLGQAV